MKPPPKKRDQSHVVSPALDLSECLAKTFSSPSGITMAGRCIFNHCQIVGKVAQAILRRMPDRLRDNLFPEGSELIAAAHDVGKVSPYFQEKIYRFTEGYRKNSFQALSEIHNPDLEKEWGGHAGVSMATTEALKVGGYIPEIVGSHHGFTPDLGGKKADAQVFGGKGWQIQREILVNQLKEFLCCDWPKVHGNEHARALAGLTTVSDWIGSGSYFEDPESSWESNIKIALDNAGFVKPVLKQGLSFERIFGFAPHAAQKKLFETINNPGVYILEAPMGSGKTEAALYAAYRAITQYDATGIYFALPTQITSEKIFNRVNAFLESTLDVNCPHRNALLLHSNAWLKETEIGEEGRPGESWFNSAKRKILAPFGVGTIDQALMGVMNVKHGFVRAFGLAGKVVILDEVHSYDTYTGTILNELVSTLKKLDCTIIILSATLNFDRRKELLGTVPNCRDYPLISASPNEKALEEIAPAPQDSKRVDLIHDNDSFAKSETLLRAEQGQLVLWIENTVEQAQDVFSQLSARAKEVNVQCGLLHSRFIQTDRDHLESRWVNIFEINQRASTGSILIGTQVLEQSLDIDADFMVVRFCPTDMLLQRLGRLWRHPSNSRPDSARREACILSPGISQAIENPEQAFRKSAFVYNPYVLVRSLEVWKGKASVNLPEEIRDLIEDTYREREEHGKMAQWKRELFEGNSRTKRTGVNAMKKLAQIGLSRAGATLPENKAKTRYSEQEMVQVLLLSNVKNIPGEGIQLKFINGNQLMLPKGLKFRDRQRWRELATQIAREIVQVPVHQAPKGINKKSITWLRDYMYLGSEYSEESLVRVALVKKDGELASLEGGVASDNYNLQYDPLKGYIAKKHKRTQP